MKRNTQKKNTRKRTQRKKKKTIWDVLFINVPFTEFPMLFVYVGVMIVFFILSPGRPGFVLRVQYADAVEGTAQLFCNCGNGYREADSIKATISKNHVSFHISRSIARDLQNIRLDPLQDSGKIKLSEMTVYYAGIPVKTFQAGEWKEYLEGVENLTWHYDGEKVVITSRNSDPMMKFSGSFQDEIFHHLEDASHILWCIEITLIFACLMSLTTYWAEVGEFLWEHIHKSFHERLPISGLLLYVLSFVFAFGAYIMYMLKNFLIENFNGLSFEEVVFHLKVPMAGTGSSMIEKFFDAWMIGIVVFCIIMAVLLIGLIMSRRFRNCHIVYRMTSVISVAALLVQIGSFAVKLEIPDYISAQLDSSTFIADHYVAPESVALEFPEKKRNLIWIYMESMESTFISKEDGGAMKENYLPEMTTLAQKNINFSESSLVGGATSSKGATWTIAALFAQTSGLPLLIPIENNAYGDYASFAPGAYSLGQILEKQGYQQEFMVGSDIAFGGRKLYFTQHGNYNLFDYNTAISRGKIDKDYYVWWGYEDQKLYSYAKEELTQMAKSEEPFSFGMLTVDTHFIDGYVCDLCEEEYGTQYENVLSCASRQVAAFVSWIQKQDFYENTTIIISGDHPTMDTGFIGSFYDGSQSRKVYNCFINAAAETKYEKNRDFNTFDYYPTALASLGVQIDGEKLGLGTNLFSGEKTLAETYGYDMIEEEFSKTSSFYKKTILQE